MIQNPSAWTLVDQTESGVRAGLRFGDRGTHTSRTMMLTELTELLAVTPSGARREDYAEAIVEDNVLGKQTAATRRLTNQRLGELYALDPQVPLFRVLLRLWRIDTAGQPLMALLCALARDPLLRATAQPVLNLPVGSELMRQSILGAIRESTGSRLNDAVLDKVARNAGSSWTQSGHLQGRVRKIRQRVRPTVGPAALAIWLGSIDGLAGEQLLDCRWTKVLDRTGGETVELTLQAKRLGLIQARIGGGVVEIDTSRLEATAGEG